MVCATSMDVGQKTGIPSWNSIVCSLIFCSISFSTKAVGGANLQSTLGFKMTSTFTTRKFLGFQLKSGVSGEDIINKILCFKNQENDSC